MTPLQLINALEAKQHFGTSDNTLIVLRHTTLGYPISMFKRLIEESDWDRIYYLTTYDGESTQRVNVFYWQYLCYRQQKRLRKLAALLGEVERLFIGQYHEPIARHFGNVLTYETLYLIDDGTSTLETNDERKRPPKSYTRIKSALVNKFVGLYDRQADRVVFFTAYNVDPRLGDAVVANRYEHFRQQIATVPTSNEIWFLGEPLVTDGYLTEPAYVNYLKELQLFYGDKQLVYIPHSREQQADVVRLQTELGCEVRQFGLPIEIVLSRSNPRPSELASFITSALPNCSIMFGKTILLTSVYLKPGDLRKHHEFVESIYQHFKEEVGVNLRVLQPETFA